MGFFGKVWDKVTDLGHAVTGLPTADEKRRQQKMMSDQVEAYKRQTALAESEIARSREEKLTQKKRLEEKQVRSLRRGYRSPGFLDSADGMSSTLGG